MDRARRQSGVHSRPRGWCRLALFLGLGALLACRTRPSPPEPGAGIAPTPSLSPSGVNDAAVSLTFLERTTAGASANDTLPMVVALHGLGDRPDSFVDFADDLPSKVRLILPRGPRIQGTGFSWFSFPPVSDAEAGREVAEAAANVAVLIAHVARTRPTRGKAIVTGFSQGGFLTFAIALRHPEGVQAAFPISGRLLMSLLPGSILAAGSRPPIVAFHGIADRVVPIGPTRASVLRLKELGVEAELREYPDVGHTISCEMHHELLVLLGRAIESAR